MRMIVTALAALSLAACGDLVQIDDGSGGGAGGGGNGAAPAAGGPGSRPAPPGPIRPGGRNTREGTIAACVADLTQSLPRGTNVQALCECTVDRMIAGTGQMDAVRQCARAQNITLPGQ